MSEGYNCGGGPPIIPFIIAPMPLIMEPIPPACPGFPPMPGEVGDAAEDGVDIPPMPLIASGFVPIAAGPVDAADVPPMPLIPLIGSGFAPGAEPGLASVPTEGFAAGTADC